MKLTYLAKTDKLIGYSDASLGLHDPKGKSVSGHVVKVFGDTIDWGTKRQNVVATSSMEAEYIALNKLVKDLMYLTKLCERITNETIRPKVYEDNQSAIRAVETGNSKALKHLVSLKYKFVVDEFEKKTFILEWIKSKEQIADVFTKALARPLFEQFVHKIFNS